MLRKIFFIIFMLQNYHYYFIPPRFSAKDLAMMRKIRNFAAMTAEEQLRIDERYMRMAIAEAQLALASGEVPIGAVVVAKGQVLARAHNMTETLTDVTAHAEMQGITMAANRLGGKYLTECTLYVTVEPCTMCAGALGWAQVSRIVYGCADEKRGYRKYAPGALHPRCSVTTGVLEEECRTLMQEFFRKRR